MLRNLQLGEFIYEQPALPDVEYNFKHSLTLEVAYNSVLTDRRRALHERTGAAIESLYAEGLDDHLDELAHQYRRAGNLEKAIEYLRRAGEQTAARGADSEAIAQLEAALELIAKQQDDRSSRLQAARPFDSREDVRYQDDVDRHSHLSEHETADLPITQMGRQQENPLTLLPPFHDV